MALNKIYLICFYIINYKKHYNFRNKSGKTMLFLFNSTKNFMFKTRQRFKFLYINNLSCNIS
jgi:hypothetical protein